MPNAETESPNAPRREPPASSGGIPLPEPPAWMKAITPPEPDTPTPAPAPATPPPTATPPEVQRPAPAELPTPTPAKAPSTPAPQPPEPATVADETGAADDAAEDFEDDEAFEDDERLLTLDPLFIYGIALVVTVLGLGGMPLEARLTLVWTAIAGVGLMAILVDEIEVLRPSVRDLAIGVGYATLVGVPILVIGSSQLGRIAADLFSGMSPTTIFLLLVFAMPTAETLFFRGAFQASRGLIFAGAAAGIWSCLLLLAGLTVTAYPLVAIVIGVAILALNFLYSYLAAVYNLFTAWACQIAMNALLLWLPSLL
ncbi:MAG: hypothetical protein DYG88_18115 [Chloroflexi bacterium CFX4]|nr:hypothetical protein [Chloroflexi bacterium CFX4]